MKRIVSVVLSIVMIAAMLLSITGCGKGKTDKELYGKWEITMNLFEVTGPLFDEKDDFGKYIDASEFVVTMRYEFDRKGKYTITTDEEQLAESVKKIKGAIRTGLEAYFDAYLKEEKLEMTMEELLAASGLSMDSLIDSMMGDEIVTEMIDDLTAEGRYYVKDGKIYMSTSPDVKPTEDSAQKYEISGKKLTIYAPDQDEDAEGYPMVLKRIK